MMIIKKLLFLFAFLPTLLTLNAQSLIGIQMGGDLMKNQFENFAPGGEFGTKDGFSNFSPTIGVFFRKKIIKNFYINLNLDATRKSKIKTCDTGIVGYSHLGFNNYRLSPSIYYKMASRLYLGTGVTLDRFDRVLIGKNGNHGPTNIKDKIRLSLHTSMLYVFKNFDFRLYFDRSLKRENALVVGGPTCQIQAYARLGFSIGYHFSFEKDFGTKKVDCPTF